jgi:putative ABC transport system permease protein
MTFRDFIAISVGNLWRMKLRAFLTTSGVVIAIAAFVSMLSFGAGNQQYVTQQFNELGLFSTMQVYPPEKKSDKDTATVSAAILDDKAVQVLANVPGVRLAYPFDAFPVTIRFADSELTSTAQALPSAAVQTKVFSQLVGGAPFTSDSGRLAMVPEGLMKKLGITIADSLIGRPIYLSVELATIDSGLAYILHGDSGGPRDLLAGIRLDSLRNPDYRMRTIQSQLQGALSRFLHGFMNARTVVSDTLTVCGVFKGSQGRLKTEAVIIPAATARRFNTGGFSGDPIALLTAMNKGTLFAAAGDSTGKNYPQVTLDIDPYVPYESIRDSIKAMGYETFSYAEQFKEIRRFFFYFDLALGVVGLIALITASLGIVNTMVMSIVERTREIGVLKSLGADERDIRLLFLVESGVIGSTGAILGIVFGWLITRLASAVAQIIMTRQGLETMELFALPIWLVLIAFCFGLIVSLLAGSYPARRAARVDPVQALRNE